MQKTTLEEWKIIREEPIKAYLTHSIYEGDNSEFAFYFSQIEEWSLMKYCSKLQIYQNKLSPKKIYDSESVWFLFDETNFRYDWTLEKLVCFRQLTDDGNNNYSFPFIIINLFNLTYAKIDDDSLITLSKDDHDSITGTKILIDKSTKTEKNISEIFQFENMNWVPLSNLTQNEPNANSTKVWSTWVSKFLSFK